MTDDSNSSVPPLVTTYFNQLIVVKPEALLYRSSPVSPSNRPVPAPMAEKVTLAWDPVNPEEEPSALAAWFVNLVRPEIGPDNATALQEIIQAHWNDTFGTFFRSVADYRHGQDTTAP